jgi:hypothetical protein
MDAPRNRTGFPAIRAGEILTATPVGPKLLVLVASDSPCVVTYQGLVLQPGRPDPCSQRAVRTAPGTPLRPGDLLEDRESGLLVRCIRPGASAVHCNGRQLVRHGGH